VATRGIDVRQTASRVIFRASLKDASGAKVTSGTTELRLYRLEDDGTLDVLDWVAKDFVSSGATDDETTMTHQLSNGADNTGLWTYVLSDAEILANMDEGQVYIVQVTNSGATPESQEREFQFGGVEGDNALQVDWADGGRLDTLLDTAAAGTAPTVEEIRAEMDSNSTQLAAILEDTGTTLPAQIAEIDAGAGTGAYPITVTVTDGADPLENATVRVTLSGLTKALATTDSSGEAELSLDAADGYIVSATASGHTYTPETRTVTGSEAGTLTDDIEMTASGDAITPPSDVSLCTVQFQVRLADTPVQGAVCSARLAGENQAADGILLSNAAQLGTTDADGIAELQLVRADAIVKGSGVYRITVKVASRTVAELDTTIPAQSTILFEDLL
jgi:hypothetical protein